MVNMEYGIWKIKNSKGMNVYRTIGICRHHGLQEMRISINTNTNNSKIQRHCLKCQIEYNKIGKKYSNISGCPTFTGLYIAENILKKAFSIMIKAHYTDPYDFICGHGLKIDSKCSVLYNGRWQFNIKQNMIPDMFCLIALNNTSADVADNPSPKYVWLIPGNAIIDDIKLNNRKKLSIRPNTIQKLDKYRRTDMEGKIIKCCDKLK